MFHFLLILFFLFSEFLSAQIPANYIRSYGSTGSDGGIGVCSDVNGNTFATGYFGGSMFVDSTHSLTTSGGSDIYILKNDADGNLLWAISAGGPGLDRPMDIVCDATGNVYVTGFFSSNASFGSQTVTSNGLQDFFISKYDTNGNLVWVRTGGGTVQDEGKKLDVDASGNCVVTGTFSGTAIFGTTILTSMNNSTNGVASVDIFITFYSPSGNLIWVKKGSSQFTDSGTGITFDNSGSIYLSGQFSDTISFSSTYPNQMYNSCFILKLDYNGNDIWFRKIAGGSYNFIQDIGINTNGKIVSTGYFKGSPFIDSSPPVTFQANYDFGVFIIQWDVNGLIDWIQTFGSECYVDSRSISFDDSSNIYLGGNFKCKLNSFSDFYGEGTFNSIGFQDVYVVKFNSSGILNWARNFGGQLEDNLNDISVNIFNQPVFTGKYENRMMFPVLNDQSFNFLNYGTVGLPTAYEYQHCNEFPQWRMFHVISKGQTDAIIAKSYNPDIGPYYYYYNDGDSNCERPFIEVQIALSTSDDRSINKDTIESCFEVTLAANSNTSRVLSYGQQSIYSPGPRFKYYWSTGDTTRTIQVIQSATIWVRMFSIDSCFSSSDTIVFIKHQLPQKPKMSDSQGINIIADTTQVVYLCKPDSLQITVHTDPSYQLEWITNPPVSDTTSINISILNNYLTYFSPISNYHSYLCRVIDENGCTNGNYISVNIDTALSTIQPRLAFSDPYTGMPITSDTIRMCYNYSSSIMAGIYDTLMGLPPGLLNCYSYYFIPYSTYSWSIIPNTSSSGFSCDQAYSFDIDTAGWYTVNCIMIRESPCPGTPADTFTFQKNIYILFDPVPSTSAAIAGNTFLCPGDSLQLTGSGGPYYHWYFNYAQQNILISTLPQVFVMEPGTYTLIVSDTNQFGCIDASVADITVIGPSLPTLVVSPPNSILCPGDSVSISCLSSGNYTWYGPTGIVGLNSSTLYLTQPGLYYCVLDSAGCNSTSLEVSINGYATPTLTVSPSEVLCPGESLTLDLFVSNGSTVQWLPPLAGSAMQQIVSLPGTYVCQVNSCGITTIDSVVIIPSLVTASIIP